MVNVSILNLQIFLSGRIINPMATTAVIIMEANMESKCVCEMAAYNEPSEYNISVTAKTKMLNTLLPSKFPMAISNEPIRSADIEITSSGNEVVDAKNNVPKKESLIPAFCAMFSPK